MYDNIFYLVECIFTLGRNNQEVQKGIIPNKARAEELATAQFNATKKELTASESRGSFFRRRRNSHRRSKSLSKVIFILYDIYLSSLYLVFMIFDNLCIICV